MKDPIRGVKGRLPEEISRQPDGYTDLNGRTADCGRGGLAHTPLASMTVDGGERKDKLLDHRIELELTHYAGTGARYRVTYLGKTLIESARDPEFEACRALLAKGFTGTLVTYSPGSSVPRMRVDIAKRGAADDHRQCNGRPSDRSIPTTPEVRRPRWRGVAFPT